MVIILAFAFISLILSSQAQNINQSNPLGFPLIQSASGYLTNINLQGNFFSALTSRTGYMLIATYSPKTILVSASISSSSLGTKTNCAGFMQYNCTDNSICLDTIPSQPAASSIPYSSPYFTVELGNPVQDLVQIPQVSDAVSSSGTISPEFPIIGVELASSCQTNEFNTFGQAAHGIIGLANRSATDVFAIYINQTSNNAILFQSSIDFNYASTDSPVLKLPTNYTNWAISGAMSIYANQSSISFSSKNVIFDINSDAIGLSADIYSSFLSMLSGVSITNCYGEYLPVCTYSGSTSSLRDIIIGVGTQNITIPPQVYIKGYGGIPSATSAITLNFKLIDSSRVGLSYVTDTYSNNTIILCVNFMKYYFTVFNGDSSTIDLYLAANPTVVTIASTPTFRVDDSPIIAESTTTGQSNSTVKVVSSISAVALLGLGLWYYLYRRRCKPLASLSGSVNASEISLTTKRSAILSQQLEI